MGARQRVHVVIAGGGVAALETLLALRELAGPLVDITLLSGEREFVYRPVTLAEAFDRGEARACTTSPRSSRSRKRTTRTRRAGRRRGPQPDRRDRRRTNDPVRRPRGRYRRGASGAVPGAFTFRGRGDVPVWPLPLYELALMTASHLNEHGAGDVKVTLVTPEEQPLELFGPAASEAVQSLLASRGITLRCSSLTALVRGRTLLLAGGAEMFVDRVISLPVLEGPNLPGLPHDQHGFIPVDSFGRASELDRVYAAGDVTAFPLKQGGLATQQADAVAGAIAAMAGAAISPMPFRPVLRGLLFTGGAPLPTCRATTVAAPRDRGDRGPAGRRTARDASAAAGQALWWPPAKIAGRYLAPYLATARPSPLAAGVLADRVPVPGPPNSDEEQQDALALALLLADCPRNGSI